MTKELDALEKIRDCVAWCAYDGKTVGVYEKYFKIIEKALKPKEKPIKVNKKLLRKKK